MPNDSPDRPALTSRVFEACGFQFNSVQNALDHADKITENCNRWFAGKGGALAESYKHLNCHVHVEILDLTGRHVGQLEFVAVPPGANVIDMDIANKSVVKTYGSIGDGHYTQGPVDFVVPKLVQGPEGFIPSHVGLVSQKMPRKDNGNLRFFAGEILFGRCPCLAERELGVFRLGVATQNPGRVKNSVVKAGSEAVQDVEGDGGQCGGDGPHICFEQHLARLAIFISKEGVWATLAERSGDHYKLGQVHFGA